MIIILIILLLIINANFLCLMPSFSMCMISLLYNKGDIQLVIMILAVVVVVFFGDDACMQHSINCHWLIMLNEIDNVSW